MTTATDQLIYQTISVSAPSTILVDHRVIASGDELALLPQELESFTPATLKIRRASGAARIIARELMCRLGYKKQAIPKMKSGVPLWPTGLVGSLAHDSEISVAATALQRDFLSVGVDVEPAEMLEPDLLELVVAEKERRCLHDDPCHGRLFFSIKESVYKAVFPIDGTFLDHHDIEVCLTSKTAIVRNGRIVNFSYCISPRIVTVAFIPA